MAAHFGDGDYLGAYRRFFVEFLDKVDPNDQLPIKTSGHDVTAGEIVGEIIHMTLQYLDQELCPPSLQCYIVQLVVEEIKSVCRKQPETCGFRQDEKTYAPLKLMQAVTGKVNEICQRYLENSRLALLPPPPSTPMPLATAFAIKNNRRKMEDRHIILHDLNTIFNIKDDSIASYYAVFDGHAGHQAAVFCATHLHQYLAESRHYPTDPERALRDAFLSTDASFIEKSARQALSSGTTAVCALILNRKLYVAWVGDSQAALAKRGNVTQLVNPHKPDRNDERERVEEMGGTVMHLGIWRVNGNLAVSRAIGDAQYKPYVTGDPEIRCITLDGNEDFLIIACDGLWDCVTEEEAATLVYRDLYRDPYDYASLSQRLVEYAKNQGSVDNITVIVVYLATPWQIASRSTHGNPLLADVQMNNMEPDNRYLSNVNAQYDVNSAFVKQQQTATTNNGSADMKMDEDYENYGNKSSNGKSHENGDKVVDYDVEEEDDDDLGPETDVDAVDDASEPVTTLADVSRQLFTDKPDPSENYQNDECMDEDSPPSPTTKSNQRALIPDADNVGDSEDSEDEWNYYRIDPNKEKEEEEEEAGAAGFSPVPNAENVIADNAVTSSHVEEHQSKIELEENPEVSDNDTDTSSDSESEREIRANVLADTEISTVDNTKCEAVLAETTDTEVLLPETSDEQEEKKIKDEEGNKEFEDDNMAFQLNPDAAEFVPVSPTVSMPTRVDLDMPISGSPLKQTPPMDDIKIPSRREFENEVRHRPHDIEEKTCTNGRFLDNLDDGDDDGVAALAEKPSEETSATNLDESEVSSTKAEFGDESSFFTASELQRTGVSAIDCSYTGSYALDDSTVDPMTKSFAPDDFMALGNPVDLNAVHDLTDADLMAEDNEPTPKTEVVEMNNHRNVDDDDDEKFSVDALAVNESDNPLDSSSPVPFCRSPVSQITSEIEIMEVQPESDVAPSELLEVEPEVEEQDVERSPMLDDLRINEPIAVAEDAQPSVTQAQIHDDNNASTKLLEMDLEDRGSQDCGFEKCNEKWQVEEIKDESEIEESIEPVEAPIIVQEVVEDLACLPKRCDDLEKIEIEETPDVDKIAESFDDFRVSEDLTSSRHSSITDEAVMQNPLDLNVAPPKDHSASSRRSSITDEPVMQNPLDLQVAPHAASQDEIVLENDTFGATSEMLKAPESPEVELSPLVDERSKNPFSQLDFTSSASHAEPRESDAPMSVDDDVKSLEKSSPFEHESLIDHKSPADEEKPIVQEAPLEDKRPVDVVNPLENESPIDHVNPPEEKCLLDYENAPKPEVSSINENSVDDSANVSAGLQLSESLQEFTGLEKQLNPERVSNGLSFDDNLMDTDNEATKDACMTPETMKMVAEEVESNVAELIEATETKTIEEKKEMMEKASVIVATAAATVAAVGSAVAAKTSKAKPAGKVAPKTGAATKNTVNKSTPTSPTKPASARTPAVAKKTSTGATSAARPNKLETVGKSGNPSAKASASQAAKSATTKLTKTTVRSTTAPAPKAKPSATSVTSTKPTASADKKPTSNGDATRSTTTSTSNRTSSISGRITSTGSSKSLVKSSTIGGAAKSATSTTTTTTTATSATSRPKTASSTTSATASRLTSKTTTTTTTTSGSVGAPNQRPKTAPSSGGATNLVAKSRATTAASTKSPITEKQIKETANKQISSSRTSTTTSATKTSRVSGNSSSLASTRRLTAAKNTSTNSTTNNTATQAIPPPIKKPASMNRVAATSKTATTNGKTSVTKTISSTATTKAAVVVENGVCVAEQGVEVVTSTTTMTVTNNSNDEDVPKKDISPVEPPTDNQLIITAD